MFRALQNMLRKHAPKNWPAYLLWSMAAAGLGIAGYFGFKVPDTPPPPVPVWKPGDVWEPPDKNYGWVDDQEQVQAVAENLVFRSFAATPAGKVLDPLPPAVYLWEAYTKIHARPPPSRDQQNLGSCVAFGTSTAIERTMAASIAFKGEAFEYRDTVQESVYGGSRVQIGKNKIRGDGSIGAWAAQFVNQYGILARGKQGKYDLSTYSVALCRSWGNSGVPADLVDVCKEHPVQQITQVTSWGEAKQALASGYAVAICSNMGFEGKRDANGVKAARGSWAHCMCLDGYHVEGGKEYGHIENSWGPRPDEGPVGWGNPPTSGFWTSSLYVERMLAQKDSWAFSMVKGFPASRLDWFALQRERQRLPIAFLDFALLRGVRHAVHQQSVRRVDPEFLLLESGNRQRQGKSRRAA